MIQMEIGFNIIYLLTIYLLVILMFRKHGKDDYSNRPGAKAFIWAFLLLAIGDTGHVGFRVLAYANGGLENNEVLVGLGALATAITITIFYLLMVEVWRKETAKDRNWIFWLVVLITLSRFVFMSLNGNDWGQVIPPYEFSLIRNVFLTAMGIIVMILFLDAGLRKNDRFLISTAIAVICSFAFYIPVILFVQKVPMIGMLMIPKTIAYVLIAIVGYNQLFVPRSDELSS